MKIIDENRHRAGKRDRAHKYRLNRWYALFLGSILSLGTGGNAIAPALASVNFTSSNDLATEKQNSLFDRLPSKVANAVRQDLSRRTGIPLGRLRVNTYSRQTWPGGCLGLERPGEVCTRALVPGWRIVLTDGSRTWVYRTDINGRVLRLENQNVNLDLPDAVGEAVLEDAARRSGLRISQLEIVKAERRDWPDGCLGLADSGIFCTQAIVPGWRVTVEGNGRRWVYRTNNSGSVVKFDRDASNAGETPDADLPNSVADAVLADAARRSGRPTYQLRIIKAERRQWPDGCLGLGEPGTPCTLAIVGGWRVTVADGDRRWVYRTNSSGSVVRFDRAASGVGQDLDVELPDSVAYAVLQDAARRSGSPTYRLRIVKSQRQDWPDGCLGLARPGEFCTRNIVPGWEVAVEVEGKYWLYRANQTGSVVKFDRETSNVGNSEDLPDSVTYAVLQDAARRSGLPTYRLRVAKAERHDWSDGEDCQPPRYCPQVLIRGWRVTVEGDGRGWVYLTNQTGSVVKFDRETSNVGNAEDLPDSVADAVLRDVARRSGWPSDRLRIVAAERRIWPDGCLGLGGIADICLAGRVAGWRVTVAGGDRRWVYHTDESGSRIVLNPEGSDAGDPGTAESERIPQTQLPPSLRRNAIFRAISSGGFAGRTYETNLLEDGRVVRVLVSPNNSAVFEREINRISRQQVERFQELLDEERFYQFDRLDYRAPRGAADYITVTLTGRSGTVRYADLGQNRLPDRLQTIVRAWNEIANPN
jgi:hypothetical protein